MPAPKPYANSKLARFLQNLILELRPTKTQAEIAAESGFKSRNMLSQIKTGTDHLPPDRVPALAKALGVDPARLLLLAREQSSGSAVSRAMEEVFGTAVTKNELRWLEIIRDASDDSDPSVTTRARAALRAIFGK